MQDQDDLTSRAAPPGWIDLVTQKVDFEAAFKALDEFRHFHTQTLRGMVRKNQLRTAEAWRHFELAEMESSGAPLAPGNREYLFDLRLYQCDAAILDEAMKPEEGTRRRTDQAHVVLSEFETMGDPHSQQAQIMQLASYNLVRGEYGVALDAYEKLCEESRARVQEQQVGFHFGAAAAAKELRMHDLAERHYESAELGAAYLSTPFKVCLYAGRLYTLMKHWGRPDEAKSWLDRLERVACPPESRQYFVERARVFTEASAALERIFVV